MTLCDILSLQLNIDLHSVDIYTYFNVFDGCVPYIVIRKHVYCNQKTQFTVSQGLWASLCMIYTNEILKFVFKLCYQVKLSNQGFHVDFTLIPVISCHIRHNLKQPLPFLPTLLTLLFGSHPTSSIASVE